MNQSPIKTNTQTIADLTKRLERLTEQSRFDGYTEKVVLLDVLKELSMSIDPVKYRGRKGFRLFLQKLKNEI